MSKADPQGAFLLKQGYSGHLYSISSTRLLECLIQTQKWLCYKDVNTHSVSEVLVQDGEKRSAMSRRHT